MGPRAKKELSIQERCVGAHPWPWGLAERIPGGFSRDSRRGQDVTSPAGEKPSAPGFCTESPASAAAGPLSLRCRCPCAAAPELRAVPAGSLCLGLFPSYSLLLLFLSKSIKCSGGIWGWRAAVPGDEVSRGGGNSQGCTPEDALAVLLSAGWARAGGGQPGKEHSVTRPGYGRLHKALPLPPACVCSAASV